MTLQSLQTALASLNIYDEIRATLEETRDDLAELNRGQLFLGQKSDGGYLPFYKGNLEKFGSRNIKLYDTGDFWKSIKVDVKSDKIVFSDTDYKYSKLKFRFGKDILGLSSDSKNEEYIPLYFRPLLFKKINAKLGR